MIQYDHYETAGGCIDREDHSLSTIPAFVQQKLHV